MLSNDLAIKKLKEQIDELDKEIQELTKRVEDNIRKASNELIKELSQKKQLKQVLEELLADIQTLKINFSSRFLDNKDNKLSDKINKKNNYLDRTSEDSKNYFVLQKRKNCQEKIEELKEKRKIIAERQQRKVDRKIALLIKRRTSTKEFKNETKIRKYKTILKKWDYKTDYYNERKEKGSVLWSIPRYFSEKHAQMLDEKIKRLEIKRGKYEGHRRLSDEISRKLNKQSRARGR